MEKRYSGLRPHTLFLVHYEIVDIQGRPAGNGLGRTLDICAGGMLLETEEALPEGVRLLLTLGMEEHLVSVQGRLLRSEYHDFRYRSGIEFLQPDPETRRWLAAHIARIRSALSRGNQAEA
ncbi:MAG: hypothetical protein BWK76_19960 [Desulfobulbaceae bacterium A2]|nr:MAG: hypothetical protein BWK76_19960 [Desulfobulbaceae bacterium A2]